MNLSLVRLLGQELCSITLFVFAKQLSKLYNLGMVFLDPFHITSSNVYCPMALNQDLLTDTSKIIWICLLCEGFVGESVINRLVQKLKLNYGINDAKELVLF